MQTLEEKKMASTKITNSFFLNTCCVLMGYTEKRWKKKIKREKNKSKAPFYVGKPVLVFVLQSHNYRHFATLFFESLMAFSFGWGGPDKRN